MTDERLPLADLLPDQGYDTDDIQGEIPARGAAPKIPTKQNRNLQYEANPAVHAIRNQLDNFSTASKEEARLHKIRPNSRYLPPARQTRCYQNLEPLCSRSLTQRE